ncbi:LPS translocon maturation chaperone LptM [Lysobacter sp. A3-1-A15]|uniref:LPS translocon maturation chaperone LptM n=1 Tax=Novilysobacter viscosus TaxID=3098602 RepID=UPI002ED8F5AE
MDIRPATTLILPALLALSLAACGNKGPLVQATDVPLDPERAPVTATGGLLPELAPAQADTDTSDEVVEDGLLVDEAEATGDTAEPPVDDTPPGSADDDGNG